MPPPPIVPADHLPASTTDWLVQRGFGTDAATAADVLFFERFGPDLSAIVLVPADAAGEGQLPTAAQLNRTTTGRRRTLAIEQIADVRDVSLRMPPARLTAWGMQLNWLTGFADLDTSAASFARLLERNNLSAVDLDGDTRELLHASFAAALVAKRLHLPAPRLPLVHNHRSGCHYFLWLDKRRSGPKDLHILVYRGRKPNLFGVPTWERNTAAEYKPGLQLLATWNKRIRFYLPTAAQWLQWFDRPTDTASFPDAMRDHAAAAIAAALRLRAKSPG